MMHKKNGVHIIFINLIHNKYIIIKFHISYIYYAKIKSINNLY